MAWVRVDDTMTFNPKIMEAGNAAVGAWIRLSAYSSAHGLDGFVPDSVAKMIGNQRDLDAAVRAQLLHQAAGGYQIHDFLEYNPSADEVAANRLKRQEAGRAGGKQSGNVRRSKNEANASPEVEAEPKHGGLSPTNPVPSRPDPDLKKQDPSPARARVMDPFVVAWSDARLPVGAAMNKEARESLLDDLATAREFADKYPPDAELCQRFRELVDAYQGIGITLPPTPAKMRDHLGTLERLCKGEIKVLDVVGRAKKGDERPVAGGDKYVVPRVYQGGVK
jgi:general stress protein YciG